MIYQLYAQEHHKERLFGFPPYVGFGLTPDVNASLSRNCPELENPRWCMALAEYAAMLHLWRNPPLDNDDWIGFTSYRQLDKVCFAFADVSCVTIPDLLSRYDVLGWGFFEFEMTILEQADFCHPGLSDCLTRLLGRFGIALPAQMAVDRSGLFCNYWLVAKTTFAEYMRWSWPLVQWMLEYGDEDHFLEGSGNNHSSPIGFAMERLFIVWYYLFDKSLFNLLRNRPFEKARA